MLIRVDVEPAAGAELRRVVLQWSDGGETGHLVPLSAHVIDDDLIERIARRVVELRDQSDLFILRPLGGVSAGRKRRQAALPRGAHSPDGVSTGAAEARQVADSARCETKS